MKKLQGMSLRSLGVMMGIDVVLWPDKREKILIHVYPLNENRHRGWR